MGKSVCKLARERGHDVVEIDKDTGRAEKDEAGKGLRDGVATGGDADTDEKREKTHVGNVDVVIDFSKANATEAVCGFCRAHCCPLVTGTTGRDSEQQEILEELKKHTTVCEKANFSKGIELTEKICKLLAPLNWDCDVVETHRKGKADRPSGTAKDLCKTLLMGGTRTVCIHSLRSGSNFGRHEIVFGGNGESLTITHQAENVDVFARGALDVAEKIVKENKGGNK